MPFFLTWSVVNSVHWANGSTQALPATTILLLLTVWLLVGFPLTVIGGIFGKNNANPFDAPCRTKNIAREIPPQPWYKSTLIHMTVGGFLPFRYPPFYPMAITFRFLTSTFPFPTHPMP